MSNLFKQRTARTTMTLFLALFTTVVAWAESLGLQGDGSQNNPFLIENTDDWVTFAEMINNGQNADAYYKLENDLTLGSEQEPTSLIVGIDKTHCFKGTFNGNYNTITVYMSRTQEYAAPFGAVDGATFMNLTVQGNITTTSKYISGIAAFAVNNNSGVTNFINCISSVNLYKKILDSSNAKEKDASAGGLLGQNDVGTSNFENCIFNGTISGDEGTEKCGGFINWSGQAKKSFVYFTNCVMAGTINPTEKIATFYRGDAAVTITNSYYVNNYSGKKPQGTKVEATLPADAITQEVTICGTSFYLSGTSAASLIINEFPYTALVIEPELTVSFNKQELIYGTDYETVIEKKDDQDVFQTVSQILDAGVYRIIINGKGNYAGSLTTSELTVYNIGPNWTDLQDALDQYNTVILTQDYTAGIDDVPLSITRTVTLDLNGHTIDRGLKNAEPELNGNVITVQDNGNLTVTDNNQNEIGTITGGNKIGNGGGIVNLGKLTVKNGFITSNTCMEGLVNGKTQYGNGGGIYINNSKAIFHMEGGSVSHNNAQGGGGGIQGDSYKEFIISGGDIIGNTTVNKGGGIRLKAKSPKISDCMISENIASNGEQSNGGGIYLEKCTLTIERCIISDNEADLAGGGIFLLDETTFLNANNVSICGNESTTGGCIRMENGSINAEKLTANNNLSKDGDNRISVDKGTVNIIIDYTIDEGMENLTDLQGLTANVTFNRTFPVNKKQTVCLPFDPSELNNYGTVWSFTGIEEGKIVMTKQTVLYDGTPYIFENTTDDEITSILFENVTFKINEDPKTEGEGYTFYGTFSMKSWEDDDQEVKDKSIYGFMAFENEGQAQGQFVAARWGTDLRPFCAYLKCSTPLTDVDDSSSKAAVRGVGLASSRPDKLEIVWKSAESATNVSTIGTLAGQIVLEQEDWYGMDGVKLDGIPTQKGTYVSGNGIQIMIK